MRLPRLRAAASAVAAGLLVSLPSPYRCRAGDFADQVISYAPGSPSTKFQSPGAALGPIEGDTSFGGLTPFNPPFAASQIVVIQPGGSLALHLAAPVSAISGKLGVFVNNGIVDVSTDGSGQAGNPAATFSPAPQALVSVSGDGNVYVPLSALPITFDNPTNYYLDASISNYFQNPGSQAASQEKPFLGHLPTFNGKTYGQMLTLLDGSAGGTWLDLSASGLLSISDVRFDVPAGASYRMVLDSVSAIPEPGSAAPVLIGLALLRARNRPARTLKFAG